MKLSWSPAVVILGLLATWSAGQNADPSNVLAEFDIARDGDAVVLPGLVGGKSILFLVDTGSSQNALDTARLPTEPKETMKVLLPSGGASVRHKYALPASRVAGKVLQESDRILGINLQQLRDSTGYDIYGILGMEFLRRHVIRIDFDRGKLAFLRKVPPDSGTGMCLTATREGVPCVTASLSPSVEDVFQVSTGQLSPFSGNLKSDVFRRLHDVAALKPVDRITTFMTTRSVQVRLGQVNQLTVGPFPVAKAVCSESVVSTVSLAYLSRFQVVFDFPNGLMYLIKGRRFDEPDGLAKSSIHLVRTSGQTIIESVGRDRAAEFSGLRPGDVLLRIADTSADAASLFQLRKRLCATDKEVSITVRRGDRRIDTTLMLVPPAGAQR
jgi:hypothetical protein